MKKKWKQMASLALAAVLTAGALAGCAKGSGETGKNTDGGETAMGRYLEEEIALPEGVKTLLDLQVLEDGTLRIAGGTETETMVYDSPDNGSSWEKKYTVELGPTDYLSSFTFAPDGGAGLILMTDGGNGTDYQYTYRVLDQDGASTELPILLPGNESSGGEAQGESETGESRDSQEEQTQESGDSQEGQTQESQGRTEETLLETGEEEGEQTQAAVGSASAASDEGGSITMDQNSLMYLVFDGNGNLYGADFERNVHRINRETGEIEQTWPCSGLASDLLVLDDQMMVMSEEKVEFYDLKTGESRGTDQNLTQQLAANLGNYVVSGISPVLFEPGEEKDTLYFCDSSGLYRHVAEGNVSEQIIDGALNSLGNPSLGLISMGAGKDGSFLIAAAEGEDFKLLRYTYSKDTPSKPSTEIKAYSLEDNLEVRQAISMYQKEHPDVFISLQIGVTGEDGVTVSDALRTLNTDIAAGKGPDLFLLDGMPVDSYIEKGLLRDLSGIVAKVAEAEGLYENITDQYRNGEELCAVPTRFSIPVLQTETKNLSQSGNLEQIAQLAANLRRENPDAGKILDTSDPDTLVRTLYTIDSPFWKGEDGSLKEDRVVRFFELLKEIYDLDEHEDGEQGNMGVFIASGGQTRQNFMTDISVGAMEYMYGGLMMNMGMLSDMNGLSTVVSINQTNKDMGYQSIADGNSQIYVPGQILGISSQSQNIQETESFVEYLLSEEAQTVNQGGGFPVNQAAFEKSLENKNGIENTEVAMSDTDGGIQTLVFVWPSDEEIQKLRDTFAGLNTPSLTDNVILEAVAEQGISCLEGSITAQEAAKNALQKINLYLAE